MTVGVPERRFARMRSDAASDPASYSALPDDGLCLSVFLLLQPPDHSDSILFGKADASADWMKLGGLDAARLASLADRWMLPACQLELFESPDSAAKRVAAEQLGAEELALSGPRVFSESYARSGAKGRDPHWDLHFVYVGLWSEQAPAAKSPWKDLKFVAISEVLGQDPQVRQASLGRGHGDIIELAFGRPQRP